jgi:hypothetical protein
VKNPYLRGILAVFLTASFALVSVSVLAIASDGGEETGKLEHVVSLEGKTGASLLLAKWYNEDRLIYALVVTATMALLGIIVGQVTEFALRLLGVR